MADFAYEALDSGGTSVTGVIQAESLEAVADRLRGMGLFPMSVTPALARSLVAARSRTRSTESTQASPSGGRVGKMDVVLFTRQLADLVSAGLPLDRALTVLIRQSHSSGLKARLTKAQEDVRAGRPLSDALAQYPREFPRLYVNMVRAGEATGQLGSVLERLAGYLEREVTRRSQILSAMTYPAVLVCVALAAVTFLLSFVIPKLSSVFDDLGRTLPLPTQILLGVTHFLIQYWWELLIGMGLSGVVVRQLLASETGRAAWDEWKLRFPVFGTLLSRIVSSRFVRSLGTMLSGGVPILESLEIAREAVGNVSASRGVERVRESIRQGENLADAMEQTGMFLPMVVHMAAVGEETGQLAPMLVRTADSLDFEIDSQIRRLVTLIEPLIVLLMGAFVGFVVLSILLPIFEANMAVGR